MAKTAVMLPGFHQLLANHNFVKDELARKRNINAEEGEVMTCSWLGKLPVCSWNAHFCFYASSELKGNLYSSHDLQLDLCSSMFFQIFFFCVDKANTLQGKGKLWKKNKGAQSAEGRSFPIWYSILMNFNKGTKLALFSLMIPLTIDLAEDLTFDRVQSQNTGIR